MGQYVRGVSIRVPGQQPLAQGLSGDDEGDHVTLQLPDNPRPGLITGRQYELVFGGGNVRTMRCKGVDRNGIATFRR